MLLCSSSTSTACPKPSAATTATRSPRSQDRDRYSAPRASHALQQKAFDQFRERYNFLRPLHALTTRSLIATSLPPTAVSAGVKRASSSALLSPARSSVSITLTSATLRSPSVPSLSA